MAIERVLVADDDASTRELLFELLTRHGCEVLLATDGEQAIHHLEREELDLVLTDVRMPGLTGLEVLQRAREVNRDAPVVLITGYGTIESAVEAMRAGAFDYLVKPVRPDRLDLLLQRAHEWHNLVRENRYLRSQAAGHDADELIGSHPSIVEVVETVRRAAQSKATVLIQGESGTGKELVALAIHQLSSRGGNPFIPVHCGAIPESLLESELFGHEKGSFTGAIARKEGVFKLADGGTLFLDEVSEMSVPLQVKLLRVLETGTFRRVGGVEDIHVDVRVVAATNRELRELVDKNLFRQDLYYRLNVFPIVLPPLRERRGDIPMLVEHFCEKLREAGSAVGTVSAEAIALLDAYQWPGNVRELENVLERAVILSGGQEIQPEHLPLELRPSEQQGAAPSDTSELTFREAKNEFEKHYLETLLAKHHGTVAEAAKDADMSRAHFYELIKKYGIDLQRFSPKR